MNRFFKNFMTAAAVCGLLRLSITAGAGDRALALLRQVGEDERFTAAVLGLREEAPPSETLLEERVVNGEEAPALENEPGLPAPRSDQADTAVTEAGAAGPKAVPDGGAEVLSAEEPPEPILRISLPQSEAKAGKAPAPAEPVEPAALEIKNGTSYALDVEALLAQPLPFSLEEGQPQVLILHTHGSEAYSQAGGAYEESDHSRTEDKTKSVIRVGDVLADGLAAEGLSVLHDTELYDYPHYSGSYGRSLAAVERTLAENPSVKVVIDLHRDAASTPNGGAYRTEYVAPGGMICSQLMLIAATGEAGLSFPAWRENLGFALRLQQELQSRYPGLARPLYVAPERYNEHAAPAYLLIEVGTDGNTLAEAENAARLLAECLGSVLAEAVAP